MNVLVIGAGSMGQAIIRGLNNSGNEYSISVIENNEQNAQFCYGLGLQTYSSISDLSIENPDEYQVCVIAVKPSDVDQIAKEISTKLDSSTVILSIAAGITLGRLQQNLDKFPIVRAMPNLAASEMLSATAMCSVAVSERDESYAREILETFGTVDRVNENDMNIVTAVSGSGPAYYFLLSEHIVSAAVEAGLDAQIAQRLVLQTFKGSAILSQDTGSFGLLREQVTSPGGTTQAAIEAFESMGLEKAIKTGIAAAIDRSKEINEDHTSKDS